MIKNLLNVLSRKAIVGSFPDKKGYYIAENSVGKPRLFRNTRKVQYGMFLRAVQQTITKAKRMFK